MSDSTAELRGRHALVTERMLGVDSTASSPELAKARELWDGKLVQVHVDALLDGVQLYPLDEDGRCTACGLHIRTLEQMQQDEVPLRP